MEETQEAHLAQLRKLAAKVAMIQPGDHETAGMLGFLIGAIFGLIEACRLGYNDRLDGFSLWAHAGTLASVAESLAQNSTPDSTWLAEYHFNSALHRINADAERIAKYMGSQGSLQLQSLRLDVNDQKHSPAGLDLRRRTTMSQAVQQLARLVDELNSFLTEH